MLLFLATVLVCLCGLFGIAGKITAYLAIIYSDMTMEKACNFVVFLLGAVLFIASVTAYVQYGEISSFSGLFLLLGSCGAMGGLLFAAADGRIEIPGTHIREGNVNYVRLGVLNYLLFGVAGGMVIFLILPSIPDFNDNWGLIKVVALALIGGYSGRLIIEKTAPEQMRKQGAKISELDSKFTSSEEKATSAFAIMYSIVNNGVDYDINKIKQHFVGIPQNALIQIFGSVEQERRRLVLDLIEWEKGHSGKDPIQNRDVLDIRSNIQRLLPLIRAIVDIDTAPSNAIKDREMHYHYATLAYLNKDMSEPNWNEALKYIKLAIKTDSGNETRAMYLYNVFICNINLSKDFDDDHHKTAVQLFEKFLKEDGETIDMVMRSRRVIAPKLHSWIAEFKSKDVCHYLDEHELTIDYMATWNANLPSRTQS